MTRATWIAAGVAATVTAVAWLLLAPVPIEPVAWRAPAPPARTGVLAPNDRLRGVERVGGPDVAKPEATAIDAAGRIHAGLADGRVVRIDPATGKASTLATTGGRPLGMAFDAEGLLYVCDAAKGLLRISPSGEVTTLATGQAGLPFGFADDVSVAPDGMVYFTDATWRFGVGTYRDDILEHAGTGRLLSFDPRTGRSPCSSPASSSRTAWRSPATAATSSWPRPAATGCSGTGSPGRGAEPPSPSWRTCPASPTT